MRLARVIGNVTLGQKLPEIKAGSLLIVDAFDADALHGHAQAAPRDKPMPESLVVFDELGASEGQIIAISEGGEATMPFIPDHMPCDAYAAAIIDTLDLKDSHN